MSNQDQSRLNEVEIERLIALFVSPYTSERDRLGYLVEVVRQLFVGIRGVEQDIRLLQEQPPQKGDYSNPLYAIDVMWQLIDELADVQMDRGYNAACLDSHSDSIWEPEDELLAKKEKLLSREQDIQQSMKSVMSTIGMFLMNLSK